MYTYYGFRLGNERTMKQTVQWYGSTYLKYALITVLDTNYYTAYPINCAISIDSLCCYFYNMSAEKHR